MKSLSEAQAAAQHLGGQALPIEVLGSLLEVHCGRVADVELACQSSLSRNGPRRACMLLDDTPFPGRMVSYSMGPFIVEVQYAQRLVAQKLLEAPGLQ